MDEIERILSPWFNEVPEDVLEDVIETIEQYVIKAQIKENKKYRILMQDYNPIIPKFTEGWTYEQGLKSRQSEINHISYLRQEELKKDSNG